MARSAWWPDAAAAHRPAQISITDSSRGAERIRTDAEREMQQTAVRVREELGRINTELNEKVAGATELLADIAGIGKAVRLLSLNATIEARRAGEQGAGFAVVAEECATWPTARWTGPRRPRRKSTSRR